MSDEQWFIEAYDRYVDNEASNPVALEKSIDAVANAYIDAVESGVIEPVIDSLYEQGRHLASRYIRPARDRRRNSMRKSMDQILDALRGDTILGTNDPIFKQAFPLGDGTDKSLGYWSQDDYRNATTERYRNAASVTAAATQFDDSASQIADAMASKGVAITRDAFK